MSDLGKQAFNKYLTKLCTQFGVPNGSRDFSLTPPMENQLKLAMMEQADFLKLVNWQFVRQITGQVVNVGDPKLHTGRKQGKRFIRPVGKSGYKYNLVETDSGASIDWNTLAEWANAGDDGEFMQLINQFSAQTFALDVLKVAFNGVEAADGDTDPEANPLGEDVNVGWHQYVKNTVGTDRIITDLTTFGEGGDFLTLDAMVADLINTKIPSQFRTDPRLTVLVGADLVAQEQYRLYQEARTPTEKIAAQLLPNTIAGRQAIIPPYLPGRRLVVTFLSNLHIYTQRGTQKRNIDDSQDRKGFENQYWRYEGYAVGDPDMYAAYDETAIKLVGETDEDEADDQP